MKPYSAAVLVNPFAFGSLREVLRESPACGLRYEVDGITRVVLASARICGADVAELLAHGVQIVVVKPFLRAVGTVCRTDFETDAVSFGGFSHFFEGFVSVSFHFQSLIGRVAALNRNHVGRLVVLRYSVELVYENEYICPCPFSEGRVYPAGRTCRRTPKVLFLIIFFFFLVVLFVVS